MDSMELADMIIIIDKQFNHGVDNLRLEKYMYYVNVFWMLQQHGQPLMNEPFKNWLYGPTIPDVYDEYRKYGGDVINKPEPHLVGITSTGLKWHEFKMNQYDAELINFVIDSCHKLKAFPTFDLVNLAAKEPQAGGPNSYQPLNNETSYYYYQHQDHQFWNKQHQSMERS